MRLFLVRHGETVDNVAGLYAGVRDSPLTAHGVLQARRLGDHLAKQHQVTHVFSSDLQRAVDTAVKIVDAQLSRRPRQNDKHGDAPGSGGTLKPLQLVDLRERDFGSAEGKKFGTPHGDAETHEDMRQRAARFVQGHLVPLLGSDDSETVVAVVVAHGLILNSLFRVLQARFGTEPRGSEASAAWSNTGYLEAVIKAVTADMEGSNAEDSGKRKTKQPQFMTVVGANVLRHLEGLKKTKGGIGNAQFDKRQRTMDSFFGPASKKPRVDRESKKS